MLAFSNFSKCLNKARVCLICRGQDFRKDYSNLAMLCATFPSVPVVALTATASKADVISIKGSLNLKNPVEIIGNPDRPNVFYKKIVRKGTDLEFFQELLHKIASDLLEQKLDYPLTILYLPLKWCGFAFGHSDIWVRNNIIRMMPKQYLKTGYLPSSTPHRQML